MIAALLLKAAKAADLGVASLCGAGSNPDEHDCIEFGGTHGADDNGKGVECGLFSTCGTGAGGGAQVGGGGRQSDERVVPDEDEVQCPKSDWSAFADDALREGDD